MLQESRRRVFWVGDFTWEEPSRPTADVTDATVVKAPVRRRPRATRRDGRRRAGLVAVAAALAAAVPATAVLRAGSSPRPATDPPPVPARAHAGASRAAASLATLTTPLRRGDAGRRVR